MRKQLYLTSTIRRGRRLRDENEPGGGTGSDNNTTPAGGNSEPGGTPTTESNNTVPGFDPATFWQGSKADDGTAPLGESAQPGKGSESGSQEEGTLQEALTTRLESMTFGDPVFTAEVTEQINSGDFKGVQERIDAQLRTGVRQSLGLMVSILKPFAEQITNQMREEMQSTFTTRDDSSTLESMFPAAKNPAVRPMIESIYNQALKNTKGDRESAVKQTKEMLKFAAGVSAGDLGIDIAPHGSESSGRPATAINWLDELTQRPS